MKISPHLALRDQNKRRQLPCFEFKDPKIMNYILNTKVRNIFVFSDSEQKITDFCEREVSWVHATLLNFEDELDVRINVQTSELEDQNKELFKFVFPDGKVVGNIVQEDIHGRLTITNVLSEDVNVFI